MLHRHRLGGLRPNAEEHIWRLPGVTPSPYQGLVCDQALIAPSSGEAEYYVVVRGTWIALGIQALYSNIGLKLPIRVWTDSFAALGSGGPQGLGKLRHLECHSLWVQQRLRRNDFKLLKVAGEVNPADLLTKH